MPTSQDFQKRLDLTALEVFHASDINQNLETAYPADDKGLNIVTTDTAVGVPDVPDPSDTIEGVSVSHWQNYSWLRRPHADDEDGVVIEYHWNPNATSDATYLKWQADRTDISDLEARVDELETDVATASTAATAAQTAATNATNIANTANTAAETATTNVTNLTTTVNTLQTDLNNLWSPGDVKASARSDIVVSHEDPDGWLYCNGREVAKATYPNLFAAIGTTYGAAADPTNNFLIPDYRGRVLVGSGTGSGLTARNIGSTLGAETKALTIANIPDHSHRFTFEYMNVDGGTNKTMWLEAPSTSGGDHTKDFEGSVRKTDGTEQTTLSEAFSLFQPSIVVHWYIKT